MSSSILNNCEILDVQKFLDDFDNIKTINGFDKNDKIGIKYFCETFYPLFCKDKGFKIYKPLNNYSPFDLAIETENEIIPIELKIREKYRFDSFKESMLEENKVITNLGLSQKSLYIAFYPSSKNWGWIRMIDIFKNGYVKEGYMPKTTSGNQTKVKKREYYFSMDLFKKYSYAFN